jgi:thioredoxin-dependent peroxiredoxin
MLKVNDQTPLEVQITDQNGEQVSLQTVLSANPNTYIVVYFYPKDDTPGCTTEACNFRDDSAELAKHNAVIVGVSKDDEKSHQKFAAKHSLLFPLWADTEHKLMEAFGVWAEHSFMGRKYMGTSRSTFIINPEGKIVAVWEKVKPANHSQEVIAFLESQTA